MTAPAWLVTARGAPARRIAIDTMCFVYHFEGHGAFGASSAALLEAVERGSVEGATSVLTLTELTVAPLRAGRSDLAREYRRLLSSFPHLELVPIGVEAATCAAELRAAHGLRTPDSLHLACAVAWGADVFVTGDRRLACVAEVDVVILPLAEPPAPPTDGTP